jgi:hypothetical protein
VAKEGADEAHAAFADVIWGRLRSGRTERAGTHGLDSTGARCGIMRPLNLVVGSALAGARLSTARAPTHAGLRAHSVQLLFLLLFWTFPRSPAALRQLSVRRSATGSDVLFFWVRSSVAMLKDIRPQSSGRPDVSAIGRHSLKFPRDAPPRPSKFV